MTVYRHPEGLVTLCGTEPAAPAASPTCPGCSGPIAAHEDGSGYGDCRRCGGLVTVRPVLGVAAAYRFVKAGMGWPSGAAKERYFDIQYIEAATNTLKRRHGWHDPATGLVTQSG